MFTTEDTCEMISKSRIISDFLCNYLDLFEELNDLLPFGHLRRVKNFENLK
jgi:hypothetical protein